MAGRYFLVTKTGPIPVHYSGEFPLCLWCNESVTRPSADGVGVCPACDCGRDKATGEQWCSFQYQKYASRFQRNVRMILGQHQKDPGNAQERCPACCRLEMPLAGADGECSVCVFDEAAGLPVPPQGGWPAGGVLTR